MIPVLAAALALSTAPLSQTELASALAGEVPVRYEAFTTREGRAAGRGVGAILIARPAADVWAVVSRYDDRAEYIARLRKVTVREKTVDALRCTMEVDFPLKTLRYTAWYRLDPERLRVSWKLDASAPDNDVRDVEGDWRVYEAGPSRALLVYRTYVDLGRLVPGFARRKIATRSIPDLLRGIRMRVESGGTWRKPGIDKNGPTD